METNANYTIVGAFVIVLLAAIVLIIIWLSAGFSVAHYKVYKVYMKESVSGLSLDAPVEYNGVNVGEVKTIEIDKNNPQLVDVLLNIQSGTPITKGTRAKLNSRALTGVAFIALEDKGTDMKTLRPIGDERYPVIATAPSFFLRVDSALTQLNNSFQTLTTSLRGLLDKENLKAIKETLQSLQNITANLANNSEHINNILTNTAKVSRQFTPLVDTSISAVRSLEEQTIPTANRAMTNLDVTMRNLSQVSSELKQNPAILIRGKGQQQPGPGETE